MTAAAAQKVTYMCILPLNIANEKIFFAFWLLFMLLFSVSILAFVYRILTLSSTSFRKRAIKKLIDIDRWRTSKIEDFLGRGILKPTAIGDWYMLLQVGKNIDGHYFNLFVKELAKVYKTEWKLEYGEDLEANETLEQDNQKIPLVEVNSSQ